jgi:hypothetical protein
MTTEFIPKEPTDTSSIENDVLWMAYRQLRDWEIIKSKYYGTDNIIYPDWLIDAFVRSAEKAYADLLERRDLDIPLPSLSPDT